MDFLPPQPRSLDQRLHLVWRRGVRLAVRLAIALGLSTVAAIFLAAAVADNALVQILVIMLAAAGLWLPFLFVVTAIDRLLERRRSRRLDRAEPDPTSVPRLESGWSRLHAMVPDQSQRLAVLRRSLDRSRAELGQAELDPEAHDLCLLIDRRLPELIDRELDALPPDDTHRRRQLGELVDLIEQFARHCSRSRTGEAGSAKFEAAVLRRRFEARLTDF